MSQTFDKRSAERLAQAHPLLQKLMTEARKEIPFQILQSQRGRVEQNRAYAEGHSKARFGQSAHNWSPAIALDIAPIPLDWKNTAAFRKLANVILPLAKKLDIPITWGGSWKTLVDMPHYELRPWREWAAKAKPYEG
jgi:peptidoglycan L-alanyl-D-glutamate endopeptidase CwlK